MLQVKVDEFRQHERDWRNKFKRKVEGRNEGRMSSEVVWLTFAGVCGIWTYCERESESIREVMCSRRNKCRGGPAGGWTRAKLKTPAGYFRKSSSKCSKHWMNISPRERFDFAFECKCDRNAWTRRALLIAQTREEANIVDLFEGNSLYKAHFARGSGTSAVVHE
ncbi:MAG: hypothetical protein ACTS4W_01840 [Candidatus Hodgkinia cicadicola]